MLRRYRMDTAPLVRPAGAFLVEHWQSLIWLGSGGGGGGNAAEAAQPRPRKTATLVSVSDLAASVVLFGASLTVWITSAAAAFGTQHSSNPADHSREHTAAFDGQADAAFWGVCDDFFKPSPANARQLSSTRTSRAGLWRVPIASLRFCADREGGRGKRGGLS
jgi:hypothetical protein